MDKKLKRLFIIHIFTLVVGVSGTSVLVLWPPTDPNVTFTIVYALWLNAIVAMVTFAGLMLSKPRG